MAVIQIVCDPVLHHRARILAVATHRTLRQLVIDAITRELDAAAVVAGLNLVEESDDLVHLEKEQG